MIAIEPATCPSQSLSSTRQSFLRTLTVGASACRFLFAISGDFFYKHGLGYAQEMSHRPQTLYGLEDSPVGLAARILDHDAASEALIARVFNGQPEGLTRDDVLENITLYWLTNTAVSSARLYLESKLSFFAPKHVAIPVAVSVFPDEIYAAPRSWTEEAYPRLIHYNRLPKDGHFAAWEQPELFAAELRTSFRPLR
jgi:pimeloyl-ACP methyl ester carboxylesterase